MKLSNDKTTFKIIKIGIRQNKKSLLFDTRF